MKTCSVCKEMKPISEFYEAKACKDGHRNQCKSCFSKKQSEYSKTEAGRKSSRKKNAKWAKNNPDKKRESQRRDYYEGGGRERRKKWAKTENGKKIIKKAHEKYRKSCKWKNRSEIKTRAVWAVNNAVARGDIPHISTMKCIECGKQAEHYHHESYIKEKWLDVIPVCRICHKKIHAG